MPPKERTFSFFIFYSLLFISFTSCSIEKQIAKSANSDVLSNKALVTAHVGISIYEPATNKYWFNHQGDKYFVPASNTKIPTCYAAMKYLGDSLVGLRYEMQEDWMCIYTAGDPTLLHKDFATHPVINFLKNAPTRIIFFCNEGWNSQKLGSGWSWNDYSEKYMAERSGFPIYGNVFRLYWNDRDSFIVQPNRGYLFDQFGVYPSKDLLITGYGNFRPKFRKDFPKTFSVKRRWDQNVFEMYPSANNFIEQEVPIYDANSLSSSFLEIATGKGLQPVFCQCTLDKRKDQLRGKPIHSQPTDSLLKPMMHRSDNFFAEQSLLMVSNEMLGVMNDEKIIDTLLKTDFKDLPQKPRWTDGSGLSRYNLFTPQDFVSILNKMKNEFGMERIKVIFPTGGKGTISSYYKTDSGYIYGKTGTLSGVVAFSGYLYTKKGKLLIFSTLINNHQASATDVRRAIEKFLQGIREKF